MTAPRRDGGVDGALALSLFAVCLTLYVRTLTPGLTHPGGDNPELTIAAMRLGVAHPTGYPLFTWLGFLFTRLVPIGEAAYRTNLMCATLGAVAIALLFAVQRRVGVSSAVAAAIAFRFGIAETFWRQAIITEVYAPNACMIALMLWLLLGWGTRAAERRADGRLVLAALVYGLSFGTHLSNLGFAPALAAYVLLVDPGVLQRPRVLAGVAAAVLLGAAQFLWLPLRAFTTDVYPSPPPTTAAAMWAYTLGAFPQLRFAYPLRVLPERVAVYLRLVHDDLGLAVPLLGLVGAWVAWARTLPTLVLLLGMYLVHLVFFTQFGALDFEVFFIPSHLVLSVLAGIGAEATLRRLAPVLRTAVLVPWAIALAATAWTTAGLVDGHSDTVVPDFYDNVLALLPPHATLVDGRGAFGGYARYGALLGRRPDVTLAMERGAVVDRSAPMYVTRQALRAAVLGPPAGTFPPGAWFVPVLLGAREDMALYRVATTAPVRTVEAAPMRDQAAREFADATLLGWRAQPSDAPPWRVHLTTYWRPTAGRRGVVTTRVGDETVEAHPLGLDDFDRYAREVGPAPTAVVVEDVDVVVPSYLPAGRHPVAVGMVALGGAVIAPQWQEVGTVTLR